MEVQDHNRSAWDRMAEQGSEWSTPADPELIAYARNGEIALYITPSRPCPQEWLPEFRGKEILCLGAGGGHQGPILSAAGGRVTVFDNSPKQLAIDMEIAHKESLLLMAVTGDMSDLSMFAAANFDIIINPVSNLYVSSVKRLWQEAHRVLKPGGVLIAGFMNPAFYLFDRTKMDQSGVLEVKNSLPYSDLENLSPEECQKMDEEGWPLEFSHTLEDQNWRSNPGWFYNNRLLRGSRSTQCFI
jgi:SAM-dependent methyltransferase